MLKKHCLHWSTAIIFSLIAIQLLSRPAKAVVRESGWDPGIYKKCARSNYSSTTGSLATDYAVREECTDDERSWLVALHAEKSYAPEDQCVHQFDISDSESPISVTWHKESDDSWAVRLFSDFSAKTHPCGDGYFNWLIFSDQNSQQVYPRPDKLLVKYKFWYDNYLPYGNGTQNGAARVIAGWQGFWDGKVREVEVSLNLEGWGDAHSDPRVVALLDNDNLDYVHVDGAYYGLVLAKNSDQEIVVNWSDIIADLVQAGYLDSPSNLEQTATGAVWAGIETNNKTASNSIITNLYIKDFRILEDVGCMDSDLNCDGDTNILDLLHWRRLWAMGDSGADVNADGSRSILDYLQVLRGWLL